ncbi:MAG: hypothetical protein H7Y13_08240 [Sphingobacteriaceae bacterium]|nr:hypothetical protein [Sphingobacteriaceae bacterium]
MKRNSIVAIAILPIVLFTVVAFTNLPPQKGKEDKGNKSQGQPADNEKGNGVREDKSHKNQGNEKKDNGNNDHGNKSDKYNNHDKSNKDNYGNSSKMKGNNNSDHGKMDHSKMNHGNGNSHKMNGKRDIDIDWNLNNFANRKHPKDQKKVTICHNPSGDGNNGVTINVSENALKAHLNHGDNQGTCNINYSDRWSDNYVKSRENVYNTYEQTWERMSYSEALLRLAAQKILGLQTNLTTNRATLTPAEIQRREALILDLQNNSVALNSQVGVTRQRLDNDVNIIIKL